MDGAACRCKHEEQLAVECADGVAAAVALLQPHFRRPEAHGHAADYLRGLIAEVERKNGWQLAERVGYDHPRGIQRVLDRYAWDAAAVRAALRRYVVAELGDPQGVLVVDETGFPKQGRHSVGVARQYCGTLGKIANCQIGVFLGYATAHGHVGLDCALFVPEEWFADRDRCRQAGLPDTVTHQTKPQLAWELLERALEAGVPAAWVTADAVYGSAGKLRRALEARGQAYVLAVRSNEQPTTWPPYGPPGQVTVAALAAAVPAADWQRLSCGEGAQGPRWYEWAYLPVRPARRAGWVHAVLLRRHPERPDERAYYLVYAPVDTPLEEVVRAAGARWTIDDMFKLAKGQVGLDHYEVRSWQGWYRHLTLALVAFAALTIGARKKGRLIVPATFPSPSRKSAASSFGSSGPRRERPTTFWRGPAGGVTIRRSLKPVIAAAA
jgi:SRSO17 transposase